MLKSLRPLLPAFVLFGTPRLSSAADLHVPNQFATIQAALNVAMPGDTIHVHGGTYDPIVISKPVRILGDSNPKIDNSVADLVQPPNVKLAGHGFGTVMITGFRLEGQTFGLITHTQGARVQGSGFAELHIQDCLLAPPTWIVVAVGIGFGACGIDVNIPHVLLTRTSVTGGENANVSQWGVLPVNGYPGVKNPTGTVTALDSVIAGGEGMDVFLFPNQIPPGSCPYAFPEPGQGGPGIQAAQVFESGSTVTGGAGANIYEINVYKCQQPYGPPYSALTIVNFPKTLTEFGLPKLGTNWTLQWTSTSPSVALLVTGDPVKPFYYNGVGWIFSNLTDIYVAEMVPGGPQPHAKVLPTPVNPVLVGTELVAQVCDPAIGIGRPIVRVVVP